MHPDVDWANGMEGGRVHQVVRDLAGTILSDTMVKHVYMMREGLVERMDIRDG